MPNPTQVENANALEDADTGVGGDLSDSDGDAPYARHTSVHYGWLAGELLNTQSNVLPFFEAKNYGAPYFWACMTSLVKAITIGVYEELLVSLGEIRPGYATDKTIEQLVDAAPQEHLDLLWDVILRLVADIDDKNGNPLKTFVDANGCISFRGKYESLAEGTSMQNFGTPPEPIGLMENYINWISLIGATRKITISNAHTPREMTLEEWLPMEGLALPGNQNFANLWGGNQYLGKSNLNKYYSLTEFTRKEFESPNSMAIKKNTSPLGIHNLLFSVYSGFTSRHGSLYNHLKVLESTLENLEKFQTFVRSFDVKDRVSELFSSDFFNSEIDLPQARHLIKQIKANKPKYLINRSGISKKHQYVNLPVDTSGNWTGGAKYEGKYVYSIGIPMHAYKKQQSSGLYVVTLQPKIITKNAIYTGKEYTFFRDLQCLGSDTAGDAHWSYIDNIFNGNTLVDTLGQTLYGTIPATDIEFLEESAELRTWLLYYLDLDLDESGFLLDPKLVDLNYSDRVMENTSNTFLWTSENFSEGIPSIELDTTFNISPLIFPVNMFYNICAPRHFHQIAHIAVKPSAFEDVNNVPYPGSTIAGSVEWEYTH